MSGLGITEIRRFRPAIVTAVSRELEGERRRVVDVIEALLRRRAVGLSWSGAASSAAADRYASVVGRLQGLATRIGATGQALAHASLRMESALDLIRRAERRAERESATISHEGRLCLPARPVPADPVVAAHRARQDELLAVEVALTVREAEREADETDAQLALVLSAAASGALVPGPRGELPVVPPPPVLGPPCSSSGSWPSPVCPDPQPQADAPFANAAWWRGLTAGEQKRAIEEHPQWVGPRDGVPARVRHAANLALLSEAERAAYGRLREAMDDATPWNGGERTRAQERVDDLRALRGVLATRDGVERTLLLVDARGANVKAVVALGDVERAAHVATYVGGLSTTARADLRRYDQAFVRMRTQAKAIATREDVAIVTWMGYEAPQVHEIVGSIERSVVNGAVARDNADELAAFVNGLDAARDVPPHQTVWAHSYGAVLAGHALLWRSGVDDVALFGSPGEPFSRIEATGLKPGSLNVIRAPWDLVAQTGWLVHGTPATWVSGATWLTAAKPEGTNRWTSSSGHSEYLRAGTVSEHNLVALAVGRRDLLVRASDAERAADPRWPDIAPVL